MADDTDFIALYRDLDLAPDCSLEALKRAYRRRVAELHPDRRGGDDDASAELKSLNLRYAAALEFLRRHDRLPGAAPMPAGRPGRARASTGALRSTKPTTSGSPGAAASAGEGRWLRAMLVVLVVVGAIWMLLPRPQVGGGDYTSGVATPVAGRATQPAQPQPQLQLGMTSAQVLSAQGEPLATEGFRWLYGPSWISFECDQVSDWYSSALRPLHVQRPQPLPSEAAAAAVRRRHCPPTPPPDPRPRPLP